jgi:hypothetical protein
MAFLLRLPLLLLELLVRRLFGGDDGPDATYSPAPSGTDYVAETDAAPPVAFTGTGAPSSNGAPPPTAEEAIERRFAREAAERESETGGNVPPPTPLRPIRDEGHVDTEPTVVESFGEPDDVGATLTIAEPWPGYDGDTAGAIVARLKDADGATKGVVALYERANKGRRTVLKAVS